MTGARSVRIGGGGQSRKTPSVTMAGSSGMASGSPDRPIAPADAAQAAM
ncbi:hypothetical protein [Komagataeibacter europaeus]|nr:hypothetical protein [Komagataeibacter europaeus]